MASVLSVFSLFFFTATAPPALYTLSLHDALPISPPRTAPAGRLPVDRPDRRRAAGRRGRPGLVAVAGHHAVDRKSTRLNSSHQIISYAVFCLKKKKKTTKRCHVTETGKSPCT